MGRIERRHVVRKCSVKVVFDWTLSTSDAVRVLDTRHPRALEIGGTTRGFSLLQSPESKKLLTFPRSALLMLKAEAVARRVAIRVSFMVTIVILEMLSKISCEMASSVD